MDRRQFLVMLGAAAAVLQLTPAEGAARADRQLLVIELVGGNDSLNTYIPYRDPNYLKLRPRIGIQNGIPISDRVALHPQLAPWQPWMEQGSLAIIQNAHYPQPSFSHFRSREIWYGATTQRQPSSGWLGRYLEARHAQPQEAVFLGQEYSLALMGENGQFLHLAPSLVRAEATGLEQALQRLYAQPQGSPLAEAIRTTVVNSQGAIQQLRQDMRVQQDRSNYPKSAIGGLLMLASRLVLGGVPVVYTSIDGWDTHTQQPQRQKKLWADVGQGVAAIRQDLAQAGLEQQVVILIQSEFGRRPQENGNLGTDHGAAGSLTLIGRPVKGGFYGGDPALDSLVNGNLPYQVDFRQVYADVLGWMGGDPRAILEFDQPGLGLLV